MTGINEPTSNALVTTDDIMIDVCWRIYSTSINKDRWLLSRSYIKLLPIWRFSHANSLTRYYFGQSIDGNKDEHVRIVKKFNKEIEG